MKENIQANTNRQIKYALIAAFVLFFLAFVLLFLFIFNEKIDSYEIEKNGKRFGKSEFIEYQGDIFVPVPSGGRYVLEDVDLNSFKAVEDESTQVVGLDKNHVYFGNIPVPDLDPSKLQVIGKGYYTDGTNTYFCSPYSQRNEDLSTSMELLQHLAYIFSKTKKPQRYIYPYKKIETNNFIQMTYI